MDQENKVVFRNALNGYNKSDVNEYITGLAKEFARRKEDFESESARLHDALKAETEEKEALAEKYKKLSAEHEILTAAKKKTENELAKIDKNVKESGQTSEELKKELDKARAELESAAAALNTQREAAAKQKKNSESLASELTTLKNKLAEKNTEMDALKKSLTETEQVSVERYAQIAKQNAFAEKYEAELQTMKEALASKDAELAELRNALLAAASKENANNGTDSIIDEIRMGVKQIIANFDDKLANLAVKPIEEDTKKEEAPVKEKTYTELDQKIDAFFGDAE